MNKTLTEHAIAALWETITGARFAAGSKADEFARAIEREVLDAQQPEPIDMLLFCPKCGAQHVDGPEVKPGRLISSGPFAGRAVAPEVTWGNPPHRSHLCHACGTIWRPADVPTNGVASIQTRGKADTWDGKPEPRAEVTDTDRLDWLIKQQAWIQWTVRDGSIRQCQVYDQDEDESYHILSGKDRYFNTPREAIDAARAGEGQ